MGPLHKGVLAGIALLCILLIGGYVYWRLTLPFDPLLRSAFAKVAHVTSYSQYVDTTDVSSPGRTLHVVGTYLVDDPDDMFASYSTTTLSIQGSASPIVFSLQNISIGTDVYVALKNDSPRFRLSIPATGAWLHFSADDIPKAYDGIAVSGPLLENLLLLSGNGMYLTLAKDDGTQQLDGADFVRYTLRLSSAAASASDPVLSQIVQRIGAQGTVDLWVDPADESVYAMRFGNAEFTSTTTISRVNEPLSIDRPGSAQ